ncbi:MAG: ech hydrogenase subunit [Desulfonauticus sp.]|nr:ech hydrogenase subunit [Desulfonauticus sp.]
MPMFLKLFLFLLSPFAIGVILGIDRKLTAYLQSRIGPPIFQPFYDLFKLLGKESKTSNYWLSFCAYVYLCGAITCAFLFFLQADLLLIFFVQAVGSIFLVLGAFSVSSPFSQIGGQRELFQIIAYEPLLIAVIVGIYLVTGSFEISSIYKLNYPLLAKLPLLFLILTFALTIKLRKSPFDISASHHAHQEIVRGVFTEYSGSYLAIVELAHWFELVFILGLISLFWANSFFMSTILVFLTYFLEIIVDNITSRLTWRFMLKNAWSVGIILALINLIWLYKG